MREYLFRGKRLDNGEWVEGDLSQDRDLGTAYIQGFDYYCDECGLQREPFGFEVDPETVGQFTGRIDDNENKVFDGAILLGSWWESVSDYHTQEFHDIGVVSWDADWGKWIVTDSAENRELYDWCEEIKVIGNRWDNPELLEGTP